MLDERRDGDFASEGLTTLLHIPRRECKKGRSFDGLLSAGEQSCCHWRPVSTVYPDSVLLVRANSYTLQCMSLHSKNGKSLSVLCWLGFRNVQFFNPSSFCLTETQIVNIMKNATLGTYFLHGNLGGWTDTDYLSHLCNQCNWLGLNKSF